MPEAAVGCCSQVKTAATRTLRSWQMSKMVVMLLKGEVLVGGSKEKGCTHRTTHPADRLQGAAVGRHLKGVTDADLVLTRGEQEARAVVALATEMVTD